MKINLVFGSILALWGPLIAQETRTVRAHLGATYYREELVAPRGVTREEARSLLRKAVATHSDRELVMVTFAIDDRLSRLGENPQLSYDAQVRLRESTRHEPFAEAVAYRGSEWIRVYPESPESDTLTPVFDKITVGDKTAEVVFLRYWVPRDLDRSGVNEALDVFLLSRSRWDDESRKVLVHRVSNLFPSSRTWLEIGELPWYPDSGRFPYWLPFLGSSFTVPKQAEYSRHTRVQCLILDDKFNCGGD